MAAAFLSGTGSMSAGAASPCETPTKVCIVQQQGDTHAHLQVSGSCEMCGARIEKAGKKVKGVSSISWDRQAQMIHVNYNPQTTTLETISKAIAKSGHDTEMDKADDRAYNKLPKCCKYRK